MDSIINQVFGDKGEPFVSFSATHLWTIVALVVDLGVWFDSIR